jgi:bacterioferritin
MMPVFAADFVAYEDMKAYLLDEDADLQETNQDLDLIELIGVQNWLVQKLTGTGTAAV